MQVEIEITELADNGDILGIVSLERECFSKPWSYGMIEESLTHNCKYWIAKFNGSVIGYIGLYVNGDITNVAVSKEYRGRGIASRLLTKAIDYAKYNEVSNIFLEVRTGNNIAIKLYEKNGFKQISRRKKYYEDGEDALIYCLEVGNN